MDIDGEQPGLSATEVACLAGGDRAALRTGLAMLYARGLLDADQRGRLERTGSSPRDGEPLERVLFAALVGRLHPGELPLKPRVRTALRDLRRRLERQGLLRRPWVRVVFPVVFVTVPGVATARIGAAGLLDPAAGLAVALAGVVVALWFVPRRTAAGSRVISRLRGRLAGALDQLDALRAGAPDGRLPAEAVGTVVAVHGATAVRRLFPTATRALLGHGRRDRVIGVDHAEEGPWTGAAKSEISSENPTSPF
ncbi:hypothetical protein GCM10010399_65230 [Dactylosporangium fulvum]|uniref:TIGR04222 domain-containing membrane protein n=1 Tax=Dactylosporangium fulvum TaxID=53359 RepID=A0ABY5VNW9_9ACTN|nr:TIGR04222 domain-containing membrane protein [Dactylosporangium fulvum]UWP78860.1 TIGR04222 domain-containing membrane protein [Dactylosporangium fulvum]